MGLFDKVLGKQKGGFQGLPTEKNMVYAPVTGELIALADFPDEAFSAGDLGQGCGIIPAGEIIKAPFNGQIMSLPDSKHALGLISDDGIELLIHVGVDTVTMNGKGFKTFADKGDKILMGQDLLKFSISEIKSAGFSTAVGIIVLNTKNYTSLELKNPGAVNASTQIIALNQ